MTAALDPAAERRCRDSFARQAFVLHLGGAIESIGRPSMLRRSRSSKSRMSSRLVTCVWPTLKCTSGSPAMSASLSLPLRMMPSLPLEKSPTISAVVSTPPAAGIDSASMLVIEQPSYSPAVYWLIDST